MAKPPISVIIPTLDREEIALATLRSFEKQFFTDFELIIVDQTTDGSDQLAAFETNVYKYRYRLVSIKSLPNARNVAAGMANGNILIFVDDDVNPRPDLVSSYMNEFEKSDDSVWVIGGRVYEPHTKVMTDRSDITGGYVTYYGKTLKNFSSEHYSQCEWVVGCNFAVRKDKYLEIGGFDINYIGNAMFEDCDFCYKVNSNGGQVIFSPVPQLEHLRAKTGGTRRFKIGYSMYYRSHNTVYFFRKHDKRLFLPLVLIYLFAVVLKELARKKLSAKAFYYTVIGFIDGFSTPIKN